MPCGSGMSSQNSGCSSAQKKYGSSDRLRQTLHSHSDLHNYVWAQCKGNSRRPSTTSTKVLRYDSRQHARTCKGRITGLFDKADPYCWQLSPVLPVRPLMSVPFSPIPPLMPAPLLPGPPLVVVVSCSTNYNVMKNNKWNCARRKEVCARRRDSLRRAQGSLRREVCTRSKY